MNRMNLARWVIVIVTISYVIMISLVLPSIISSTIPLYLMIPFVMVIVAISGKYIQVAIELFKHFSNFKTKRKHQMDQNDLKKAVEARIKEMLDREEIPEDLMREVDNVKSTAKAFVSMLQQNKIEKREDLVALLCIVLESTDCKFLILKMVEGHLLQHEIDKAPR